MEKSGGRERENLAQTFEKETSILFIPGDTMKTAPPHLRYVQRRSGHQQQRDEMEKRERELAVQLELGGGGGREDEMAREGDEGADDDVVVAPEQRRARKGVDLVRQPNQRPGRRRFEGHRLGQDDGVVV